MSSARRESAAAAPSLGDEELASLTAALVRTGRVQVPGWYEHPSAAWATAMQIAIGAARDDPWCSGLPELEVVGEFTVPPPGTVQRDFQALHIDFGLPRVGPDAVPVARFTALHRVADRRDSNAATRVVPLARLLRQREWPDRAVLFDRLRCTGLDDAPVEGVLARVVEAVDQSADLPAKGSPGFLCGLEFASIEDERDYFARHGLQLEAAEEAVVLRPGELLIFDNLSTAHGRRGRRATEEIHQLCIGFRSLATVDQARLVERVLTSFSG